MKYIAHRGLFNGPDKNAENSPLQISKALKKGFDCEIDLWIVMKETEKFYLGHDAPEYEIDEFFLRNEKFWIHAKNVFALEWLSKFHSEFKYFWHQNDDFVVTSNGYIWTYPQKQLTERSICLMPERSVSIENLKNFNPKCYGICSDYVSIFK
jgi:hypothetical protein